MPLEVTCPQGHKLKVPDKAAGKAVRCPKCQSVCRVPNLSAEPPTVPATPPVRKAEADPPAAPKTIDDDEWELADDEAPLARDDDQFGGFDDLESDEPEEESVRPAKKKKKSKAAASPEPGQSKLIILLAIGGLVGLVLIGGLVSWLLRGGRGGAGGQAAAVVETPEVPVPGLGGDLTAALSKSAKMLEENKVEEFVLHIYPVGEITRMQKEKTLELLVKRIQLVPEMKVAMIRDLKLAATKAVPAGDSCSVELLRLADEEPPRQVQFEKVDGNWRFVDANKAARQERSRQISI